MEEEINLSFDMEENLIFLQNQNTLKEKYQDFCDFLDFNNKFSPKQQSSKQSQKQLVQNKVIEKELSEQNIFISNKSNVSVSTSPEIASIMVIRKCSCTKSRCLKNYCECFKLGIKCGSECECKECHNHVQLFLLPIIVAHENIRCNCKKSKCLKKYCQCHNTGRKCGKQCNCINCQNQDTIQNQQNESIRKRVKSNPVLQFQNFFY